MRNKKKQLSKASRRLAQSYTKEFRLSVVRLCEVEGMPRNVVCEESGISQQTLTRWLRAYRHGGEAALERGVLNMSAGTSRKKIRSHSAKKEIIQLKKENPTYGVKRISDTLKRFFLIGASPEAVRQTLHEEKLITPPKKKRQRNITRPRFFERSTPNQMWQTDIFTFRLGGKNAYLLGYVDDYSRFIVGMGLYRSQTAENLLEVYRRASGEYNPPKEMLTDNGRQYTNWRGTTRFEKEMQKDRVKHFKSQPHHPMTLGKIERFWKTIHGEFLSRTQFDSFENAQERLAHWIKYYNHLRPHQGIKGLCPADRYFEIASEVRKTIEQGLKENELELALRGERPSPIYMVGRMEGQSVVLHAEKGKLKMILDEGVNGDPEKLRELTYDLKPSKKENSDERRESSSTQEVEQEHNGTAEMPGSVVRMVRESYPHGTVPRDGHQMGSAGQLAETGYEGDARGAGAGQPPYPSEEQPRATLAPSQQASRENSCQEPRKNGTIREDRPKSYTVRDRRRITLE